jgi:hypothetical protein
MGKGRTLLNNKILEVLFELHLLRSPFMDIVKLEEFFELLCDVVFGFIFEW